MLNGINTISSMRHKHIHVVLVKGTRMGGANTGAIMFSLKSEGISHFFLDAQKQV